MTIGEVLEGSREKWLITVQPLGLSNVFIVRPQWLLKDLLLGSGPAVASSIISHSGLLWIRDADRSAFSRDELDVASVLASHLGLGVLDVDKGDPPRWFITSNPTEVMSLGLGNFERLFLGLIDDDIDAEFRDPLEFNLTLDAPDPLYDVPFFPLWRGSIAGRSTTNQMTVRARLRRFVDQGGTVQQVDEQELANSIRNSLASKAMPNLGQFFEMDLRGHSGFCKTAQANLQSCGRSQLLTEILTRGIVITDISVNGLKNAAAATRLGLRVRFDLTDRQRSPCCPEVTTPYSGSREMLAALAGSRPKSKFIREQLPVECSRSDLLAAEALLTAIETGIVKGYESLPNFSALSTSLGTLPLKIFMSEPLLADPYSRSVPAATLTIAITGYAVWLKQHPELEVDSTPNRAWLRGALELVVNDVLQAHSDLFRVGPRESVRTARSTVSRPAVQTIANFLEEKSRFRAPRD